MIGATARASRRLSLARPLTPARPACLRKRLTKVELIRLEKRLAQSINFGRHCAKRIVLRCPRMPTFSPAAVFALMRWTVNDLGTAHRRNHIFRAVKQHEVSATLPLERSGGEFYLALTGWPRVREALPLIDAIEVEGIDPCEALPDCWHHMHSRLFVCEKVRPSGSGRHALCLRRKALGL